MSSFSVSRRMVSKFLSLVYFPSEHKILFMYIIAVTWMPFKYLRLNILQMEPVTSCQCFLTQHIVALTTHLPPEPGDPFSAPRLPHAPTKPPNLWNSNLSSIFSGHFLSIPTGKSYFKSKSPLSGTLWLSPKCFPPTAHSYHFVTHYS